MTKWPQFVEENIMCVVYSGRYVHSEDLSLEEEVIR